MWITKNGQWIYFEADKGTESGGNTGDTPGEKGGDKPATFTQADVDRIVNERLAREKGKAEAAQKKATDEAAAKALADNQQFKELSEKQAGQLAKLEADLAEAVKNVETLTGDAGKYRQALEANVAERRKGLPDHILALLDNLDPVAQLNWLTTNAEKLGSVNGVPATPRSNGNGGGDVVASFLQEQEERGKAVKNPLLKG